MKIDFLISVTPYDDPVNIVYTWEDICEYKKKGMFVPTKEIYFLIKALEWHKEFEAELKISRKNVGIPTNGLGWKAYCDNYLLFHTQQLDEKSREKSLQMLRNVVH